MLAGVGLLCIVDIEQLLPAQILELNVRSDLCALRVGGEPGVGEHRRGRFRARRPQIGFLRDTHGQCDVGVVGATGIVGGEPLRSCSADFGLVACKKRGDRDLHYDGTVIGRDHRVGIAHSRRCRRGVLRQREGLVIGLRTARRKHCYRTCGEKGQSSACSQNSPAFPHYVPQFLMRV